MIGVFGGTFDPIHYGHLRAALEVQDIFALDEVRLIPSATPPHRATPQASAHRRLAMLKIAAQHQPNVVIDTRELERTGASFMIDTLTSLRQDFPNKTLLLFIGSDAFNHLTHWHQWQQLFTVAHVVVLTRPNYCVLPLNDFFHARHTHNPNTLTTSIAGQLFFQTITQLDISATAIRNLIAQQRSPRFLLPDAVIDYITQNGLYQMPALTPL